MSQLAFDKDGQPFQFSPQLHTLSVRRFRNPGGRGTCEVVRDEDGDPLHVPGDSTLGEFRAAVGYVSGLYRLDQHDEGGDEIPGVPPAYVVIDPPRNGLLSGSADPLVVVRDLAHAHADVAKTLASTNAGMMQAATENMRVSIGAGLGNRRVLGLLANAAGTIDVAPKEADDDEEDGDNDLDDEDDDTPRGPAPAGPGDPLAALGMLAPLIQPLLPKIGEAIGVLAADFLNRYKAARPAAASSSTTAHATEAATAPPPSGASAGEAAAGPGAGTTSASTTAPTPAPDVASGVTAPLTTAAADAAAPSVESDVRNTAPTGAQIAHLLAVRAHLTENEVAVIDESIARMDGPTRMWWLGELSALSVEQAVERVRSMLPKVRQPRRAPTSEGEG